MSRAFVKEPDGDQAEADLLEKPQSEHPNYMTLHGLEEMKKNYNALRRQLNELKQSEESIAEKGQIRSITTEVNYLEKRIGCAIPVDVALQSGNEIHFGATVELLNDEGLKYQFTIVGEDEADIDKGLISWVSPLASALIGKQSGDHITWVRPAGDTDLEIVTFRYEYY